MRRVSAARVLSAGVIALGFGLPWLASSDAAEGYLRTPDLHGNAVVFSAEGDLWTAPVTGGKARRITSHDGAEYFPRFSPDGQTLAFTGEYDGNRDVFVMPADGGEPRRITWHPGSDEVLGWTPDGSDILFRSRRHHPHGDWEIFTAPTGGGDAEVLPIGRASRVAMDPESGLWAFNRLNRERRTWKRYRGGSNQDLWVGHPDRADFRRVTDFTGTDAMPMWRDGRVWFVSDEGGTGNLWSMTPDGGDRTRHTNEDGWDIRWPSMAPDGRIVFMLAGGVSLFDPSDGSERTLSIDLPSERKLTRHRYADAKATLTWFDLSPDGERLAVTTRGEVFSVPVEEGVTLPVTRGSGARESWASYGSDGETVLYVSDEGGEESIRSRDAWGRGEETVLQPAGEKGWHFPPRPSPDGEWVAWSDETQTLFVAPLKGGRTRTVDHSEQEEIRDYAWSPDGRWLAYVKVPFTDFRSVFLYDTRDDETRRVTPTTTDDFAPAWDPDGRYLHFLSNRTMNPVLGGRDFRDVELKMTRPYLFLLRPDVENPFAPKTGLPGDEDEEEDADDDNKSDEDDGDKDDKPDPVEIDFEGLENRFVVLDVPAGIYSDLAATGERVFYLSRPIRGMAERSSGKSGPPSSLMAFHLEEEEAEVFLGGVSDFDLEAGAEKIAIRKKRGEYFVVDAGSPPGEDLEDAAVSLDDIVIELDPREEWRQIYLEGWRHMRDFHWDAGLSGVDWKATRDQYATLLERVSTRDDLRDLMGEVIGELATSHTYVWGGDRGVRVKRVSTGLLGADFARDGDTFRVEKIYRGDAADEDRSPLVEPEVSVREGDHLLAVNHVPFREDQPLHAAFENLAGREVLLTVAENARGKNSREVAVTTLGGERRLRYIDWVRKNRETVAEMTDGRIGYIHVPNMGTQGLVEFHRWFYPQLDREGMIVDCRWNGGGFVSQLLLERFRRTLVSFDRSRGGGVWTYPYRMLNGPFVVLTNERAGSDGDIFPMAVQLDGLAPVIGQRSWGGVVGIRADKRLVDGGGLTQPEYAWWDPVQGWSLENRGVIPDIEVVNPPADVAAGRDPQLARAIEEVLRLHAEHPPVEAKFGPAPVKSRRAFQDREPGR
ncbi:MAG: S41 family peptidase [Gemmatimonadota bacterium]|jgi:tricorn protease|nr:hypothetical protein [Gemmatimonadota bacterium]MDP6529366.1 S41 family peptidase [Gemmatimonadota bacterium]MDP7031475.1 S41 family peptidase [Gemmatimonadota bacterium]